MRWEFDVLRIMRDVSRFSVVAWLLFFRKTGRSRGAEKCFCGLLPGWISDWELCWSHGYIWRQWTIEIGGSWRIPTKMKKSKRECTSFFAEANLECTVLFRSENHDLNLQKKDQFLQRKKLTAMAGCRWSYATKGHEGLSSLRSLGLVIRRQGGKKNSATINKVTPLLAAPWIPCNFLNAFFSFCEPLQYFVGFVILVHIKILCIFQYFYLILWNFHCVFKFQVTKPLRQAFFFRSRSTFWFHWQLRLLHNCSNAARILSLPFPVLCLHTKLRKYCLASNM